MGRELKRVAIDFTWPIGKIWDGYINPFLGQECPICRGYGVNKETLELIDLWSPWECDWVEVGNRRWNNASWRNHLTQVEVDALMSANHLKRFTHVWVKDDGWKIKDPGHVYSVEEVNNAIRLGVIDLDSLSRNICVEARAKYLGILGDCEHCHAEGKCWPSEEIKILYENWKKTDPPIGNGFQLWTTTNEGAPYSPVFETIELLCEWCEVNATTFADYKTTKENWKKMLEGRNVYHQEGNLIFG